jgi:hypothetical protein
MAVHYILGMCPQMETPQRNTGVQSRRRHNADQKRLPSALYSMRDNEKKEFLEWPPCMTTHQRRPPMNIMDKRVLAALDLFYPNWRKSSNSAMLTYRIKMKAALEAADAVLRGYETRSPKYDFCSESEGS